MADLPSYQSIGRVFSDLPQLDFANVRESFKQSQALSNQLDRLSTYAFNEMGKTTEKQAAQFAVDNQLTIEQVREAAKSGIKPEDLVKASGGGEIWQATISKIQGEQLRSQLEVLGKQALLDLQTQVDTNQIADMSEVKAKQEAIVNGMRKTLSFAPDSVIRFDATMGSVTSALYKQAQDKLVTDYKIGEQSKSKVNLDNSIRAYQAMLSHEDIKDPAMLREIEYALADQFERQSAGGGSDFALIQKDKFIKSMQSEKINFLTKVSTSNDFATDRYDAMVKIRNNDFGAKTEIYNSLDEEEKKKVRVAASEAWTSLEQSKSQKEKEDKDVASQSFRTNVILKTPRGKSGKLNDVDKAFLDNVLTYSEWKTANKPDEDSGDPLALSRLEGQISRGLITKVTQLPAGLPPKAKAKLNDLIQNQDSKDSLKIISIGANVPLDAFSYSDSQTKRKTEIEAIFRTVRNKVDANGNLLYPNQTDAADEAVKLYKKDSSVVNEERIQKSKLTQATKLVPLENFDYDVVMDATKLKKIAEDKITWMNRSERDNWVNAVIAYQKAQKATGLKASELQ